MSQKIQGTLILEGLIEGPIPPFPDAQEKLEKWARNFASGAVRISLQIDAGHFSALPSNEPAFVKQLAKDPGTDPSFIIADSLSDLLRFFPPLEKGQVFSTLRSIEYRSNEEVQTLYAVGEGGRAVTRQQTVPCKTIAPDQPVAPRDMLKRGALGLLVALVILALSSLFIDYPGIWRRMTARVEPVTVDADPALFAPYFTIQVTGLDRRTGTLLLKLTRTPLYPHDEKSWDDLYNSPPDTLLKPSFTPSPTPTQASQIAPNPPPTTTPNSTITPVNSTLPASQPALPASTLRRRLALESLAKGTIEIELLDKDGHLISQSPLRIDPLEHQDTLETAVPAPIQDQHPVSPATLRAAPH